MAQNFDYRFVSVEGKKMADRLFYFLAGQNLGYPEFPRWTEKARWQVLNGDKRAILAFSNGVVVGDGVYQRHLVLPTLLEVKNVNVHERVRGRGFARFIFAQIEFEALAQNYEGLIGDIRANQLETREALRNYGFVECVGLPLYQSDMLDYVVFKALRPEKIDMFIRKAGKFACSAAR